MSNLFMVVLFILLLVIIQEMSTESRHGTPGHEKDDSWICWPEKSLNISESLVIKIIAIFIFLPWSVRKQEHKHTLCYVDLYIAFIIENTYILIRNIKDKGTLHIRCE